MVSRFLRPVLLLGLLSVTLVWAEEAVNFEDNEAVDSEATVSRNKRSVFPFVLGQAILDIQCQAGSITVCAPDGPDGCPEGYTTKVPNKGACGFATLRRFLTSDDVSGTCCIFDTSRVTTTSASATTTGINIILPQIVAYPVYAQYPFATAGNTGGSTSGTSGGGTSANMGSTSFGGTGFSSSSSGRSDPQDDGLQFSSVEEAQEYDQEQRAEARQYGGPSPSYGGSPPSYAASPAMNSGSAGGGNMVMGMINPATGTTSITNNGQVVYNPVNLAYPPLLRLTSIPVPAGSGFNAFPPAMNVQVLGSSTQLVNALQSLLAQLIATSGVSATTIASIQNALIITQSTPGMTAQMTAAIQTALAAASSTQNTNPVVVAIITAIQALLSQGAGANMMMPAGAAVDGAMGVPAVCSSQAIDLPTSVIDFIRFTRQLQRSTVSPAAVNGIATFASNFAISPILNNNAVATLSPLLLTIASSTGLSPDLQGTVNNLRIALAAYQAYSSQANTVTLIKTLYQLAGQNNSDLAPNVLGGLGALVALTANRNAVPTNLQAQVAETSRFVAESVNTPLVQVILARIIQCRMTPACCSGNGGISPNPTITASPIATTRATTISYAYNSPSGGYGSPPSSGYGMAPSYNSPSPSPPSYGAPSYAPAPSSTRAPVSYGGSSVSYGGSSGGSGYGAPSYAPAPATTRAPVSYGGSPVSYGGSSGGSGYGSSYGSGSNMNMNMNSGSGAGNMAVQASTTISYPSLAVNQSATVTRTQNFADSFPQYLPVYPVLPFGNGALVNPAAGIQPAAVLTIPASNNSAYNFGYPLNLPQYPVLPYYVQPSAGATNPTPAPYAPAPTYNYPTQPPEYATPAPYAAPPTYAYASPPAPYVAPPVSQTPAPYAAPPSYAYAPPPVYQTPASYVAPPVYQTPAPYAAPPSYAYAPPPVYQTPAPYVAPPVYATPAPYATPPSYAYAPPPAYQTPAPYVAPPVYATPAPYATPPSYAYAPPPAYQTPAPYVAPPVYATPAPYATPPSYVYAPPPAYQTPPAPVVPVPVVTAGPSPVMTAAPTMPPMMMMMTTPQTNRSVATWGPFPIADSNVAVPQSKNLDQCGVPHATQEGDIAFLMANAQKGPRMSISRSKRAVSDREARVTNSMVAREMEVCWQAAILLDGKYQSGASIVSEWFILTAAHEIDGRDISRLRIRVGDTDVRQGSLDKDERPGCIQDIAVDKVFLHPDFDRKTLSSDIGLLRLKEPINLNSPCVCKVCLQEEAPQEGETCIVSGYGSTRTVDPAKTKSEEEAFALSGPNAELLRYAGIPIVANDVCSAAFKNDRLAPRLKVPFGVLDDTQMCAGGISQRDACYGDGGSPLVCYNGRSFYQAGVVSYGRGCGKALMAAVYGSVTAAAPWINEAIVTEKP